MLFALPAHSSLITQESGWNYDDYKATWSNSQNTSVGSLLGESGNSFVMWQSFATTEWIKYILSFSYMATVSGYDDVKLRVTVFDGQSSDFTTLLDETLFISESMKLLTYDAMFQAMSETSIVRFALTGTASGTSQSSTGQQTNNSDSLEVSISEVTVEEVSAPATFAIMMLGLMAAFIRKSARK